jgi:GT2 family glycosyltransferase
VTSVQVQAAGLLPASGLDGERVAIVVVTHNSSADLPGLLASLPAGMGPVGWELIVVDYASFDDSAALVRRLAPTATVVEAGRNGGYAAGVNAGVRAAGQHTAVLVLNADVRLGPDCVPTLLTVLREGPGIGVVVPRLTDARGALIESQRREPALVRTLAAAVLGARRAGRWRKWGEVVTDPDAYDTDTDTDWAEGSTQLISAECWSACGPWDESFFLYSEETDFDLRARDHGFATRYVAGANATHLEGGSATSPRLWPLLVVNQVRLYRRRHGVAATAAFWAATVAREASRAALGRPASRAAVAALVSPTRLRARPGPEWLR